MPTSLEQSAKLITEVDELVQTIMGTKQSKSNTKPPEDGIEPFIDSFNDAFNLESVAVLSHGYVEPALELQKGISSKLSAAGLALPVNRFLEKYLVPCVHESLADGTLDELPRAFGFFLRKPKGKQVLDRSVDVAKASNSVTQSSNARRPFWAIELKDKDVKFLLDHDVDPKFHCCGQGATGTDQHIELQRRFSRL